MRELSARRCTLLRSGGEAYAAVKVLPAAPGGVGSEYRGREKPSEHAPTWIVVGR